VVSLDLKGKRRARERLANQQRQRRFSRFVFVALVLEFFDALQNAP
jgi:hypothetical protein